MNESSNQPTPGMGAINERVKTAVNAHRVKLRVLTSAAFVFGFVAVVVSIFIVWFYLFMYLPKQRQMLYDSEKAAQQAKSAASSVEDNVKEINKFMGAEVLLTHVVSMGVTIVALSVGVLGLGMLVLLSVVILNRRVALNQINTSLAQISQQLRELQTAKEVTFHP